MSNYTKENLEKKVKKELIKIAKDLNLDSSGNRTDLINRIFDHKPSFGDMISTAPVSKDGDLKISIEEKTKETEEDIPIGVEVNDAYPDQNEEIKVKEETEIAEEDDGKELRDEFKTEPEQETEVEIEIEIETGIETEIKRNETEVTEEGMVSENTAEDILKGWRNTIQSFYRRNISGIAPTRPASAEVVADQLRCPIANPVLKEWQASIVAQLRPSRRMAPIAPKSVKQIIQIIKSL